MSYGKPVDIWGLGCIIGEMILLEMPARTKSEGRVEYSVKPVPKEFAHLYELVRRMLAVDPEKRPKIEEVLESVPKIASKEIDSTIQ